MALSRKESSNQKNPNTSSGICSETGEEFDFVFNTVPANRLSNVITSSSGDFTKEQDDVVTEVHSSAAQMSPNERASGSDMKPTPRPRTSVPKTQTPATRPLPHPPSGNVDPESHSSTGTMSEPPVPLPRGTRLSSISEQDAIDSSIYDVPNGCDVYEPSDSWNDQATSDDVYEPLAHDNHPDELKRPVAAAASSVFSWNIKNSPPVLPPHAPAPIQVIGADGHISPLLPTPAPPPIGVRNKIVTQISHPPPLEFLNHDAAISSSYCPRDSVPAPPKGPPPPLPEQSRTPDRPAPLRPKTNSVKPARTPSIQEQSTSRGMSPPFGKPRMGSFPGLGHQKGWKLPEMHRFPGLAGHKQDCIGSVDQEDAFENLYADPQSRVTKRVLRVELQNKRCPNWTPLKVEVDVGCVSFISVVFEEDWRIVDFVSARRRPIVKACSEEIIYDVGRRTDDVVESSLFKIDPDEESVVDLIAQELMLDESHKELTNTVRFTSCFWEETKTEQHSAYIWMNDTTLALKKAKGPLLTFAIRKITVKSGGDANALNIWGKPTVHRGVKVATSKLIYYTVLFGSNVEATAWFEELKLATDSLNEIASKSVTISLESLPEVHNSRIPKMLDLMLGFVETHGSTSEGIYRKTGRMALCQSLVSSCIHKPGEIKITEEIYSTDDVASAVKHFFRFLDVGIFGPTIEEWLEVGACTSLDAEEKSACYRKLFESLDEVRRDTAKALFQHLKVILEFSANNKMAPDTVLTCIAPCLYRPYEPEPSGAEHVDDPIKAPFNKVLLDLIALYFLIYPEDQEHHTRVVGYIKKSVNSRSYDSIPTNPNSFYLHEAPSGNWILDVRLDVSAGAPENTELQQHSFDNGMSVDIVENVLRNKLDAPEHVLFETLCKMVGRECKEVVLRRRLNHVETALRVCVARWPNFYKRSHKGKSFRGLEKKEKKEKTELEWLFSFGPAEPFHSIPIPEIYILQNARAAYFKSGNTTSPKTVFLKLDIDEPVGAASDIGLTLTKSGSAEIFFPFHSLLVYKGVSSDRLKSNQLDGRFPITLFLDDEVQLEEMKHKHAGHVLLLDSSATQVTLLRSLHTLALGNFAAQNLPRQRAVRKRLSSISDLLNS